MRLWDLATGGLRTTLPQRAREVRQLAYSPDGRTLAATVGWGAALWDIAREQELVTLQGKHGGMVWSLAFAPDGRTLMTAGNDGTVKVWDVATGRERAAFDWGIGRVWAAAFAADGMRAAAGGDADIVVWDVDGA